MSDEVGRCASERAHKKKEREKEEGESKTRADNEKERKRAKERERRKDEHMVRRVRTTIYAAYDVVVCLAEQRSGVRDVMKGGCLSGTRGGSVFGLAASRGEEPHGGSAHIHTRERGRGEKRERDKEGEREGEKKAGGTYCVRAHTHTAKHGGLRQRGPRHGGEKSLKAGLLVGFNYICLYLHNKQQPRRSGCLVCLCRF